MHSVRQTGKVDQQAEGPGIQASWATHPVTGVLSTVTVLFALLVLAATEWREWHFGLLIWGLVVAFAAVVYPFAIERWALHRFPASSEAAKTRLHSRQRLSGINMGIIGVGVAVLASGTGWMAVDAGFTALFVMVGGGSALAGVYLTRGRGGTGGAAT